MASKKGKRNQTSKKIRDSGNEANKREVPLSCLNLHSLSVAPSYSREDG